MASYVDLIKQDVFRHKPREDSDTSLKSQWPSSVSQFVQSLKNQLKLPRWLESGPVPYTNERVLHLLDHLRVSNDTARVDPLWDDVDSVIDDDFQQRLHVVFNTALTDCARIRAVVDIENQTDTPFPKESFLAILVRNAVCNGDPELSALEDVPVVLPRYFGGEAIPILSYITKSFLAPLIISLREEMPVNEGGSEIQYELSHSPSSSSSSSFDSELFNRSPPTMSEFLDACERTKTPEEVEEDEDEDAPSPQFEAYFLACPSAATPPSTCHIPVLCMADEERLPVLMSSLLYQRRVWHITDSLLGVEFSKYDTTIKLYVGWLEDCVSSGRVLPRVHLGEIGTPVELDLSSPSVALAVSRLLCGLEQHISDARDTIRKSVGAVVGGIQSHSPLSWRIDTDLREGNRGTILENNNIRDMIMEWAERQQCSEYEETMPPHQHVAEINLSDSATSAPVPQYSASNPTFRSSIPSSKKSTSIPELRESHEHTDSVPTFCSRLSCSTFVATTEKDDSRVFRWMFDRRVVPQAIPSDLQFREEYSRMTGFVWPETWHIRSDLPSVDAALEPCVQELLEGVAALKTHLNAIKCIPVKEFPFDLRVLEQSFSAIFQASRRSREKKRLLENVYEASWRHDHDRLLFDFFVRLVQQEECDDADTLAGGKSIAHLEDPLARPTLEATLRLPMSNRLQGDIEEESQEFMRKLVSREAEDLRSWMHDRGLPEKPVREGENIAYVTSQWLAWRIENSRETVDQVVSKLGRLPSTGRCDALGRLLVELPNVPFEVLGHFPLVLRAAVSKNTTENKGNKAVTSGSRGRITKPRDQGKSLNKTPGDFLTIPEVSHDAGTKIEGMRYTIASTSIPSSMRYSPAEKTVLTHSTDPLNRAVKRLQIRPDATRLELPILNVEYKKTTDNVMKGTNQLRMYLTASVKFLHAVGITSVPVYGVQTDGPVVVLPAAVLREDNFVYMYERLVEKLDISTPLGAWHYATILCRLAQNHAKILEKKFEVVKEDLIRSLIEEGSRAEGWTIDHQMARLKAEKRAKSPRREKLKKQKPEAN